jgi:hypothetical protein
MYIAGTTTMRDVATWPELLTDIHRTPIYKRAREYVDYYPEIDQVVGHSAGGAVANELSNEFYDISARTYGAPIISSLFRNTPMRQAHYGDPVSLLDMSSSHSLPSSWNPHNY